MLDPTQKGVSPEDTPDTKEAKETPEKPNKPEPKDFWYESENEANWFESDLG